MAGGATTLDAGRAETRIKQLCCLGIGGQAVIPELLTRLQDLVPSYSNCCLRMDASGRISYIYDPCPEALDVIPLYVREFYDAREREVIAGFSQSLRSERGVTSLDEILKVPRRGYFRHDFYNLIFRPLKYRDFIRVVLREQGTPLGIVAIHRCLGDPEFSHLERRRLAAVAPFMAHAVSTPEDVTVQLIEDDTSGLIIADTSGRIQHMSADAHRLLWLDSAPASLTSSRCDADAHRAPVLPAGVRLVCQRLAGTFSSTGSTAPPVWHHRNAWGGFVFRAYWLGEKPDELLAGVQPRIGITIQYQVPLPLKLLRHMEGLPLSNRQKQVCMLMAKGCSLSEIAEQLNIKRTTADYHRQEVYARFDVHKRSELLVKLMAL